MEIPPDLSSVGVQKTIAGSGLSSFGPAAWLRKSATARGSPRRGAAESRQALSALHAQVVHERKEGSGEPRVVLGLGAINLVVHHADQRHVPVLHNDVNGRERLIAVVDEVGVAIDGPSDSNAQLVVIVRRRQHFKVILEFRHALDVGQKTADVALLEGLAHLAADDKLVAVSLQLDVVKNRIERVRHNFFTRLLRDLARSRVLGANGDLVHDLRHTVRLARRALGVELRPQVIHSPGERGDAVLKTYTDIPLLVDTGVI